MESKDFIHNEVDWFRNPIPTPDAFEAGNMANVSPTIKIDISDKLVIDENITLGTHYTNKEVEAYTKIFKEFHDIFA